MKILVTGGAGFIGSEFVRLLLRRDCPPTGSRTPTGRDCPPTGSRTPTGRDCPRRGLSLTVIDKLTYAGDLARLKEVSGAFKFYKADITDAPVIKRIFKRELPDWVVNFAAETHVDRSITDSSPFIKTNVLGTQVLLDISRKFNVKRFLHISTDEVYGDIEEGKFSEQSPLKPSSPYAAAKAAADLVIKSYVRTYNFPAIIVRPCNNYGPWQYPEKLIPVTIRNIANNKKTPVYAKGGNIREWLFVSDCSEAILLILRKGKLGEVYNLGSGQEYRNIDVVKRIIKLLHKKDSLIEFVRDRPGHDIRYALNSNKLKDTLGWKTKITFLDGLRQTVDWYIKNSNWKSP